MQTKDLTSSIKKTFNLSESRIQTNRATAARLNVIPRGKIISRLDDVLLLTFGILTAPNNMRYQVKYYKGLIENRENLLQGLHKLINVKNEIKHVTVGQFYILVSAGPESFSVGKIQDIYLDRSITIPGNNLRDFVKNLLY